jgi:hypothetical protein
VPSPRRSHPGCCDDQLALKEANETLYWLLLCEKMEDINFQEKPVNGLNEIMAILSKIIVTSKKNLT